MNSQAETVLNDIGGTLFKSGGETPAQLASYNGRSIIVDDGVHYEAATGIADIYLFGAGAIALNDVPTKMPFEVGRDIPASADQQPLACRTLRMCVGSHGRARRLPAHLPRMRRLNLLLLGIVCTDVSR